MVDDNPDTAALLQSILTTHGYEVTAASSGAAAVTLLRSRRRPCLILIDLALPLLSGAELKSDLAGDAALKDIPVVITSASREQLGRLDRSMRQRGKPFSLKQLIKVAEEHCAPVTTG